MKKLDIQDCSFEGADVAISVANGSAVEIKISQTDFVRCKRAIEERDPVSFAATLGLPEDTPAEVIVEAVLAIRASQAPPETVLKESRLWTYIGRAADSASVIQLLITWAVSMVGMPKFF
ncbi:hypothetical protein [Pseudomonas tohonis]|uniref:hypothetical protein n=1 Tax=Pseudomonas tohonis TaxID=2725477 RepID=UPI0022F0B7F7|nr:hypothetical protein [Pseudomonas tohonis]